MTFMNTAFNDLINKPDSIINIDRWCSYYCLIFFTTWAILLILIAPWISDYVNLVLMSVMVLVVSTFIVHIWPQRMIYISSNSGHSAIIQGPSLIFVHVLLHVLPALAVIVYYHKNKNSKTTSPAATAATIALFALYTALFHPQHVYGIPEKLFAGLIFMSFTIYALLQTL